VAGAVIDVWQSDAKGNYDVQYAGLDHAQGRGVLQSGADGKFHFRTIVAEAYTIPADGPVGIPAQGRVISLCLEVRAPAGGLWRNSHYRRRTICECV
jgi:protocatechuate 3,4-dioxygenase beta subunit